MKIGFDYTGTVLIHPWGGGIVLLDLPEPDFLDNLPTGTYAAVIQLVRMPAADLDGGQLTLF